MLEWLTTEVIFTNIFEKIFGIIIQKFFDILGYFIKIIQKLKRKICIEISYDGKILNPYKFKKCIKKLIRNSENLNRLKVIYHPDNKFERKLPNLNRERYKKICLDKEKKISNIFFLLFKFEAKNWWWYYNLDELNVVNTLINTIKLFISQNNDINSDVLIDCINDKIKGSHTTKLSCTVPINENLLKRAMNSVNSFILPIEINEKLIYWKLDIGDIKDKNWLLNCFIPFLLSDTVSKLDAEYIKSPDFNFDFFYMPYAWKIGLH